MFVKDWSKYETDDFNFNCINSWGENNEKEPQLRKKDLAEVYYVSLSQGEEVYF